MLTSCLQFRKTVLHEGKLAETPVTIRITLCVSLW